MLSTSLEITINQDSPVLVRDQLVEQIGLQIASGILRSNDKLPSIRALAQKLDIHHSVVNAAYNQLAEIGMLEIRQGSGVRVAPKIGLGQYSQTDLKSLLLHFLANSSASGFLRKDIATCIKQVLERPTVKRILVIDNNPDFHPVILSELAPHFSLPIVMSTFKDLQKDLSSLKDSFVVTSLYHLLAVQALPLDPTRFMICNVEPAQEVANTLKTLPAGSIVLFVSVSPTLLKKAAHFAAGLRGESIVTRTAVADDSKEISYTMQHAKIAVCDRSSEKIVSKLAGEIPVRLFELYSPKTIDQLKTALAQWG